MNFNDIFGSVTMTTVAFIAVVIGGIAGAFVAFGTKDSNMFKDVVMGLIAGFASTRINETATKSISSLVNGIVSGFGKSEDKKNE